MKSVGAMSMTEEVIIGRNSCFEVLRSKRNISQVYLQENAEGAVKDIIELARQRGLTIKYVKKEQLNKLAPGLRHQGVVILAEPIRFMELEELLARLKHLQETPLLVLLDELQDPQNVGAIIRTAAAAGAQGVLLPERRTSPVNAVVAKVAAGALEHIALIRIGNITQAIKKLQEKGFWVVGADPTGAEVYYRSNLTGPLVLVVGAEGRGLGRLVKENCDFLVKIPMSPSVESLNASAATAVLLFEIVRQRAGGGHD